MAHAIPILRLLIITTDIGSGLDAVETISTLADNDVVMVYSAGNDREVQWMVSEKLPTGVPKFLPLITPKNTKENELYTFLTPDSDLNDPKTWTVWDINEPITDEGDTLAKPTSPNMPEPSLLLVRSTVICKLPALVTTVALPRPGVW